MKLHLPHPVRTLAIVAALVMVAASGCALNGLPRIDPSGERFFIFPDNQAVVGPVVAPGTAIAPPPGNVTLPPVASSSAPTTTGSRCPLCPLGGLLEGPTVIGPLADQPFPVQPTNRVTLSPGRVLAPVGSEVVLRAGVCGQDGYLLTNRKIEWMLDQEGVGQFAEIGDAGQRDFMRYPWSTPRKINNTYAVGYTSPVHTCLRRGTADPADDLQIENGEAWVSVTSPSEGTSYITAYAPNEESWPGRRAQATIYWVDAQWRLPPSAVIAAGQPHTLATTITRQTDGAPLQGWIVRYEVADDSRARLGYDAGQIAEITTDNRGVAEVKVEPTDAQPGAARIRITIVRPEQAGIASSPRLDVGAGEATITWSDTAPGTQPLFPPVNPVPTTPTPQPQLPPDTAPPSSEPPIDINPPGRPELEVRIRRNTPDPIKAGDQVAFTITVRNIGDGVARNVVLYDKFDAGLTTVLDVSGAGAVEYKGIGDIRPGDPPTDVPLSFDVLSAGEHWHEVEVTADGGARDFDRAEFQAVDDQPAAAELSVRTEITPVRTNAGDDKVVFKIEIHNPSDVAATNLRLQVRPDPALEVNGIRPQVLADSTQPLTDGGFVTQLGGLAAGQTMSVHYGCVAKLATQTGVPAEITALLTGDGVNIVQSEKIEILPPVVQGPPPAPLAITIVSGANPIRSRTSSELVITLRNTTTQPLVGVDIAIAIPTQLSAREQMATVPAGTALIPQGPLLRLSPAVAQIPPGGSVQMRIPYDAVQTGQAVVEVQGSWQGAAAPVRKPLTITVEP